jgi:hypothetical protein
MTERDRRDHFLREGLMHAIKIKDFNIRILTLEVTVIFHWQNCIHGRLLPDIFTI